MRALRRADIVGGLARIVGARSTRGRKNDDWILFKKSDRRICNALCVCCIVDLFACGLVLGRSVPFTVNCFGVHLVETGSPKDDVRFRGLGFHS